jgi:hypothetical protein
MNDASKFAKNRLQEASRAKQGARLMMVVFWTAAVALLLLLAVAMLDYWFMLVPSVRIAGLAVLAGLVVGGIYKIVQTLKQPTHLKEAALDAEAAKPDLGCELSTAAEYLAGERKPTQQYENELAAALEDKAATHLKKIDLPYWKRPMRPALLVAVLLVAGFIFAVMASGGITAFLRAMMPWSNASYTQVQVKPGDVEIPVGRDLEVKSVFTGRIPKEAKFQWQDEGKPEWKFAALTRNEQGEYTYPLKSVRAPLKYRVSGSDAVSPEFKIQPYTPPDLKEWNVEFAYPDYTRKAKTAQNTPEISVLRGTVASIQIAPTTKLSKARLQFKDGPVVDLAPQQNGFWKTDLNISKDTEFTVELADEKGRLGENDASYKITAIPDEVPKVEILEPGQDIRAMATNTVPVKIKAADDYGLSELRIVYHRLGGPEEIITAKRDGETNSEFSAEIPLSGLALKDYELVAYHALAVDNNTLDGPGIGKSDVFFIEITDKEGGGECKCQGKGQKVNLLVIQKQIIADTTVLTANAPSDKLEDLAKRQKDAAEFGRIYYTNISASGAIEAANEMAAAVKDMENAHLALEQRQARLALPSEETALARLYQVIRLMPELEDLPTVPPPPKKEEEPKEEKPPVLAVVLEEIKKKKEEQPDQKELEEALETAKRLQEEHASLTIGVQNPGNNPQAQGGETQIDRSGKSESKDSKAGKAQPKQMAKAEKAENKNAQGKKGQGKQGQGKEGEGKEGEDKEGEEQEQEETEKQEANEQESEPKGEANGKGNAEGKGKGKGKGQGKPGDKPGTPTQKDAEKEAELAKETKELSEKLARMSGKNARLGHGIAKKLDEAATKMATAATALGRGDTENAGTNGAQAGVALDSAVAMLERLLNGRAERVDVSKEDAPKQYEAVIAEYFKALSYDN